MENKKETKGKRFTGEEWARMKGIDVHLVAYIRNELFSEKQFEKKLEEIKHGK